METALVVFVIVTGVLLVGVIVAILYSTVKRQGEVVVREIGNISGKLKHLVCVCMFILHVKQILVCVLFSIFFLLFLFVFAFNKNC